MKTHLQANGRMQSIKDWASYLCVPVTDLEIALAEGLPLQTIIDALDASRAPSRPVTPPNPLPRPDSVKQSPGGGFSFRVLCKPCAEQAKDYYDMAHTAHKLQQDIEEQAMKKKLEEQVFEHINFDGCVGAAHDATASSSPGPAKQI